MKITFIRNTLKDFLFPTRDVVVSAAFIFFQITFSPAAKPHQNYLPPTNQNRTKPKIPTLR